MKADTFADNWPALEAAAQERWGRLTADQLKAVHGDVDSLATLIANEYGYSRDEARREIERWNIG